MNARKTVAPALLAALLGLGSIACSSPAQQAAGPRTPAATEPGAPPPDTRVATTVITAGDGGTATELFDRGKRLLLEEKYKEAAEAFDLVQKGDPQGRLAAVALLHAGIAYEGTGDRDKAVTRYRQMIEQYPKDELVKLALLRTTRIQIRAERWKEALGASDALLARADLTVGDAIEANGAKALALVETGDVETAARFVERARDFMEKNHIGEVGKIPDEVAQVYYALGEVRKTRSEKIKFEPPPPNFGELFEQRAQGLLDAQAAYTDTMRTTDPTWATMAGYRVGELYRNLHADVMVLKLPNTAKTEKDRQLFEGAMRLRYRVLLEKGLKMMEATLRMNERIGEESPWTAKARAAKAELEKEIAAQNAFLKKLPVGEADLRKLLDDLAAKRAAEKKLLEGA